MARKIQVNKGSTNLPVYAYYGKDGKSYPTWEAAVAADEAWDATHGTSKAAIESSQATSRITQQFLQQWGDINEATLSSLTDTLKSLDSGQAYAGSEQIADLISDVKAQSKQFNKQYGSLESEAIESASADFRSQRELTGQYMGLATPDYEGVTGRAATDVRGASERARQAGAREMMSYGVDPTAGKFGALTRPDYLTQARNEAIAMNLARRGEKERVTDITARGLELIDPTKAAAIASNIQGLRSGLTETRAGLAEADIEARTQIAKTKADIAGQITDVGRDYGSAGMTMLGLETAGGGNTNISNLPASTQGLSVQASSVQPGNIRLSGSSVTPSERIKQFEEDAAARKLGSNEAYFNYLRG